MEGVTIIETETLNKLISRIDRLENEIMHAIEKMNDSNRKWLTSREVMIETGFGKTWLNDNKHVIGCSVIGGCLRFKRSDVDAFIEANYFKVKSKTALQWKELL